METGYWNFHDGEHFSTAGALYGQSLMEDTKHSLLDMDILPDDFTTYNVQQFESSEPDLWDTETELNGDIAVLPLAISKAEGHNKEDFHKVLTDWQEHVGSMQASDTEEMDVKDIVGLDIAMPRNFSEHLPESIFEETSLDSQVKTWNSSSEAHNNVEQTFLTTVVKEEYNFDLENFLDCDEDCDDDEDNVGLKVVEDDIQDTLSHGNSCLDFQEETEGIFGNIELPIMQHVKMVPAVNASPKQLFLEDDLEEKSEQSVCNIKHEMGSVIIKEELDILEFQGELLLEDSNDSIVNNSEVENTDPEVVPTPNKSKPEDNEDCIDVETVSEQMPVLEAGDLKSLLEQFEASEAVNSSGSTGKPSVLDSHLFAMATQQTSVPASASKLPVASLSHQNIKDSLPKEVIDRIKASGRKKVIPVIPAMPSKKAGRAATRMQDAGAALSRNKLLKIVSGNSGGESVQLDHDYCCSSGESSPTKSFYHSDASEYCGKNVENVRNKTEAVKDNLYSQLPEYIVLAPQVKNTKRSLSKDEECWEKNAKKDSGLESGDVSDASEETLTPPGSVFTPIRNFPDLSEPWKKTQSSKQGSAADVSNVLSVNGTDIDLESVGVNITNLSKISANCKAVHNQTKREITMVSVLKKCQAPVVTPVVAPSIPPADIPKENEIISSSKVEVNEEPRETKKRKINLEQYRSRLKELDKVRPSDAGMSDTSLADTINVSSATPASEEGNKDSNCASERTNSEVDNQTTRPSVCSVEIQTHSDYSSASVVENKDGKMERGGRSRDKRQKQYRSRRVSSSSSSASSSSSSHRSRSSRRRVDRHSRRRRRRSKRNSSSSTSGTRSHRFWSRSRSSSHSSSYSRSRSPIHNNCKSNIGEWPLSEREKLRQVEERRVVYVGRIEEGTTKADLRRRFEVFGHIVDISVHFREHGDNYGFVTFQYKDDAYNAVERGNDDPSCPKYDLCFGGRRAFCKTRYADLDGIATHDEDLAVAQSAWRSRSRPRNENSFDLLLREAQAKLRKRNV